MLLLIVNPRICSLSVLLKPGSPKCRKLRRCSPTYGRNPDRRSQASLRRTFAIGHRWPSRRRRRTPPPLWRQTALQFTKNADVGDAHYVSQPPLPKVSGRGGQSVASRAGGGTPAGSLLSPRVHVAGRRRRHRLSQQGDVYGQLFKASTGNADDDRGRSQTPGRPRRRHIGSAYLGFGADPSSARSDDRPWGRPLAGRSALGRLPARLLSARARPLAAVPPSFPRKTPGRLRRQPSCSSLEATPISRRATRSRRFSRLCARPNGSSMPNDHSMAPRPFWPIWRATPIASPSPTAG